MFERAAGVFPARVLDLASLRAAAGVLIAFGGVVMIPRFRGPFRGHLGVEGPIGEVKSVDCVGEGATLELVRRKPATAIPCTHCVANIVRTLLEGEDALRANWR